MPWPLYSKRKVRSLVEDGRIYLFFINNDGTPTASPREKYFTGSYRCTFMLCMILRTEVFHTNDDSYCFQVSHPR